MIKRTVSFLAIALLALVAVMLTRTLRVECSEPRYSRAPELEVDRRVVSVRLSRAIAIRSVATPEGDALQAANMRAMGDLIEQKFPRVMATTTVERHEGSIVIRWIGREPQLAPLLMLAHLDVVDAESGSTKDWTWPPFSGKIAASRIWGRGALDDKSSALAMLEAFQLLMAKGFQPRRSLILAFGLDEELGGEGGAAIQAQRFEEEGLAPFMILDEGLALLDGIVPGVAKRVAVVGVAEKGYATLEFEVHSAGGHASMPPREGAIGILSRALGKLEASAFEAHYGETTAAFLNALKCEMSFGRKLLVANDWISWPLLVRSLQATPETDALLRTTTAITLASAGVAENVLPSSARATVNFRIHPLDTVEHVLAHARRVVRDERVSIVLREGAFEPSGLSPVEDDPWWLLERTISESFDDTVVAPGLVLGATDSRHYARLSPYIYRFSPIRLEPDDLARLHGTNERISIDDYLAMIRFYVQLFRNV